MPSRVTAPYTAPSNADWDNNSSKAMKNAQWNVAPARSSNANADWGNSSGKKMDMRSLLSSKSPKMKPGTVPGLFQPGLSPVISPSFNSPGSDVAPTKPRRLKAATLMSLGLDTPKRSSMPPKRSSMKKNGLARPRTMGCLRQVEVQIPGKGKIKRNTSITFKETVKVKRVTSSSDLADDPKDLWYQDDEFAKIKRKSVELAKMADRGEGSKYCTRGLERLMPSKRDDILDQKYECWYTVLDEQEVQRHSGDYDDEQIAKMYRCLSNTSLRDAQARARKDEIISRKYLSPSGKMKKSVSLML